MLPISIIQYNRNRVRCYDTRCKTLDEIRSNPEINVVSFFVFVDNNDDVIFVNLTRMLYELSAVATAADWAALLLLLTPTTIELYRDDTVIVPAQQLTLLDNDDLLSIPTPFSGADQIFPIIKSIEHCNDFAIDYGTIGNPSIRNQMHLQFMLHELIVRHTDPEHPAVNFNNTIPIVNGSVHYPVAFNNELYMRGGTDVLYSTTNRNQPVMLMDLSPLGTTNMELVRFTDCMQHGSVNNDAIYFTMPPGKSVLGKSALLVIANRLYMPDEIEWVNNSTFIFSPSKLNLAQILLNQQVLMEDYLPNTGTAVIDLATFIASLGNQDDYNNFIILIDTPALKIVESDIRTSVTPNSFLFTGRCGGLLVKHDTREIIDYTRLEYANDTLVSFTHPLPMQVLRQYPDNPITDISIVTTNTTQFDEALVPPCRSYSLLDLVR